ncbi:hypothetical protein MLD38_012748 [Melastoma candidum]|uniref:Uncharacterized protein n=1 Tax=Melastoma candidum TaxID=119954 RepID=A0ACB9R7W9_9MYRT|nr:hypothetical protein MLD38_012748 [Melastoma candidum]
MSDPTDDAVALASCPPPEDLAAEDCSGSPKRPSPHGMDGDPSGKRLRRTTGSSVVVEFGRVAEMVMILASMGRMRGGRDPTAVEVEMMKEARETLAELCGRVSKPRDIASRDVVARVIEELGLDSQVKEQKLGFKVPKMTIAEKMSLTKRKMEESKKFPSHTTSHAPPSLQANSGPSAAVHVLPLDKLPQNDTRASNISAGVSDIYHSGRDYSQMIFPKADLAQVSADKATNVSFRSSSDNNMVKHMSVPNERAAGTAMSSTHTQAGRPFATQPAAGSFHVVRHQSIQGANTISAPSNFAVHNKISKVILQVLTPKNPETPTWTPPSREYMNKAVICQICQGTIIDVESVLLCDACEKGYHLKCLQAYNQRGIPKAEWHCQKCLTLSHGKPLPPKYGRVMRNMGVTKATSGAAGVQSQTDMKLGTSDAKVNPSRIPSNGVNVSQNNNVHDDHFGHPSDSQSTKAGEAPQNSLSIGKELDLKPSSDIAANNQMMAANSASPGIDAMVEPGAQEDKSTCATSSEGPTSLSNSQFPATSIQSSSIAPDQSSSMDIKPPEFQDKFGVLSDIIGSGNSTFQREDHDSDRCPDTNPSIERNPDIQQNQQPGNDIKQSEDELQSVEWIGEPLDVSNGKTFYASCCVGGVTYKLGKHALFHSNNEKVTPFKLQSMWEDSELGLMCVEVSRCYFPGDLPNNICHPFTCDNNEVFESNHSSVLLAGSIKGPCEVLSPAKYKEKSEQLSHWDAEDSERRAPLFLCSWFYDELKGHFQAVSI